jgi:hypothetical protein
VQHLFGCTGLTIRDGRTMLCIHKSRTMSGIYSSRNTLIVHRENKRTIYETRLVTYPFTSLLIRVTILGEFERLFTYFGQLHICIRIKEVAQSFGQLFPRSKSRILKKVFQAWEQTRDRFCFRLFSHSITYSTAEPQRPTYYA